MTLLSVQCRVILMPAIQAGTVVEKLANRIADPEKPVRDALKALFQTSLLSAFDGKLLTPFMSLLMAHICSAMTHLHAGIRSHSCLSQAWKKRIAWCFQASAVSILFRLHFSFSRYELHCAPL